MLVKGVGGRERESENNLGTRREHYPMCLEKRPVCSANIDTGPRSEHAPRWSVAVSAWSYHLFRLDDVTVRTTVEAKTNEWRLDLEGRSFDQLWKKK